MARVTVEDCILKVSNRFELVMVAAQRARDIASGAPLTVDRDNDKDPVVALREIADETISTETVTGTLIKGLQKHVESDEPEEDEMDLLAIQQQLGLEVSGSASAEAPAGATDTDGADAEAPEASNEVDASDGSEGIAAGAFEDIDESVLETELGGTDDSGADDEKP